MASVHLRKNKAGEVSSYQVKWRLGGAAAAPWQTERFDDEPSALVFKEAVDDNKQQWPPGWVKGRGYIAAGAGHESDAKYRFRDYATASIKRRARAGDRYKDATLKEMEMYLFPTFGNCDVRSTEHFSKATVGEWIGQMRRTYVYRGSDHRPMSPKTIHNLHGTLSSVLKEATQEEPPLRARNPCELSSLPSLDTASAGDENDEDDDGDIDFLEPEEVEGIIACLDRPEDKRLIRVAYATGMRWGELTALAVRHARATDPRKVTLKVARAWKWNSERSWYIGPPKTQRSRRTLRVPPSIWQDLLDQGIDTRPKSALIFHNGQGERLPYSTFYDRWCAAVRKARELGLIPEYKSPTIHDVRHSAAAALLSKGHSLTYVQRRLGHESIQTTSDRYGHLLPVADDDAMETIEASLGGQPLPDVAGAVAPESQEAKRVYAVHLGEHLEGFWSLADARAVAEQWDVDNEEEPAGVEAWSPSWWIRQHGNGIKDVRAAGELPDRVRVWAMGPAVYASDGTELVTSPRTHKLRSSWVWEWQPGYTVEPAHSRVEWRAAPATETEAEVWGLDKKAVWAAYEQAHTDALRICGINPAAADDGALNEKEEPVT